MGKHVLIGNSHQLVTKTKINFENLIYHTMADDGSQLQIPFSVGETQFTERKCLVCAAQQVELAPDMLVNLPITIKAQGMETEFHFQLPTANRIHQRFRTCNGKGIDSNEKR